MNDTLRKQVRELKCYRNIQYKDIAEQIGIKPSSFNSWLKGYYNFGADKMAKLMGYIMKETGEI